MGFSDELELREQADAAGTHVYELLNARVADLAIGLPFAAMLTRELHVLPDDHGNRSTGADPSLRGMVSGLRMSDTVDSLALLYLATVQALAHGTRHVLDEMNAHGHHIHTLVATGGDAKNPLFVREHANAAGCRIVLPREPDAVLLGAAMLGAVASGHMASVVEAMAAMSGTDRVIEPSGGAVVRYHEAKHRVFVRMYEDQMTYRAMMEAGG